VAQMVFGCIIGGCRGAGAGGNWVCTHRRAHLAVLGGLSALQPPSTEASGAALLSHQPHPTWSYCYCYCYCSPAGDDGEGGNCHGPGVLWHPDSALDGVQCPAVPPIRARHPAAHHTVRKHMP
jgi:hypothetical protein